MMIKNIKKIKKHIFPIFPSVYVPVFLAKEFHYFLKENLDKSWTFFILSTSKVSGLLLLVASHSFNTEFPSDFASEKSARLTGLFVQGQNNI